MLGRLLSDRLRIAADNLAAKGERFILVTLTIRRTLWASPREAFDVARKERWVWRCMQRWARHRGLDHVWYLSKVELQQAGWVHWHVLVVIPSGLKIRLPWQGRGGEFDAHWPHGLSNVLRDGDFTSYASKVAAYACKEAVREDGRDGGSRALELSGLPGKNVHWVQPSQGFWEHCGVVPVDTRVARRWDDDEPLDDGGGCADGTLVVGGKGPEWASHAERVGCCGWSTSIRVDGGMRDESGVYGCRSGAFTVVVPLKRGSVGPLLEEYFRDSCVYFDGVPVVEEASGTPGQVLEFFSLLADLALPDLQDLLPEIEHRLGLNVPGALAQVSEESADGRGVRRAGGSAAVGDASVGLAGSNIRVAAAGG